jgi:hypothetical protein
VETDARTITLTFKTADGGPVLVRDSVSVDLKTGRVGSIAAQGPVKSARARKPSKKKK